LISQGKDSTIDTSST